MDKKFKKAVKEYVKSATSQGHNFYGDPSATDYPHKIDLYDYLLEDLEAALDGGSLGGYDLSDYYEDKGGNSIWDAFVNDCYEIFSELGIENYTAD